MKLLALTVNGTTINAPPGMPHGGYSAILTIIGVIITLLFIAAAILSLFYLIWGGYNWMTSAGDKQKIQSAQQRIVFAIIGLIVVFLAVFIVNVIFYFFFGSNSTGGGGGPHPIPI